MTATPLPCLKEADWAGRGHAVCRVLWAHPSSRQVPWLAFGFDHPDTFEFITADRVAAVGPTERALETRALFNLRARPATWQHVEADIPGGGRLHLLACSDDFFAAERVLDASFMQEAQRRLAGPSVYVGIPRRGLLLAMAGDKDEAQVRAFGALVAGEFARGESAVISPALFGMRDGDLVAVIDVLPVAPAASGEPARDDAGDAEEDGEGGPFTEAATPVAAAAAVAPVAKPAAPKPPFYWWTSLPSWLRLLVLLIIGLIILNRLLTDFAISLWSQ